MSNTSRTPLADLEPKEVFGFFHKLTQIPRASGNEKAVSDYIRNWAENKGLKVSQDEHNNLHIAKPGQKCAPGSPGVILQAHLDMVPNVRPGKKFDFAADPIPAIVDGDRIRTDGTTLGADDGIGVALAMAFLDSENIPHPPLEAVFTTEEETGLRGAAAFDASRLTGKYFINIDSEEEGIFYASCAGGARIDMNFPIARAPASGDLEALVITVGGLQGGHSGIDIDKGRGNSHRLMARILRKLADSVLLADFAGGVADNAIPNKTTAVVLADKNERGKIEKDLAEWQEVFRNELKNADGKPGPDGKKYDVIVTIEPAPQKPDAPLTQESFEKVLFALLAIPTGVDAMDFGNPDDVLPESSSNMAIVSLTPDACTIRTSVRSQIESKKELLKTRLAAIGKMVGATMGVDGEYPGWEYDAQSALRPVFVREYEKQTKKKAIVKGIHAGLECGIFATKAKESGLHLDFTSIGPDLREVHTPDENLGIASTGRTWELLKAVLAVLAEKGE